MPIDWESALYMVIVFGSTLSALRMILQYRLRVRERQELTPSSETAEAIADLRIEMSDLQESLERGMSDLHERVDFAEQMLGRAAEPPRIGPTDRQPGISDVVEMPSPVRGLRARSI